MGKHAVRFVAHRGWSRRFPENSLPSLTAAVCVGADEIEFDLRLSKDGIPFLCHDHEVDRVSTLSGPASSFTMSELEKADIRMPDGTILEGLGFARVDQVFQLFGGRVGMNIHIKDSDKTEEIVGYLISRCGIDEYPNVYIAGDVNALEIALKSYPQIPRCCLAGGIKDPEVLVDNAIRYKCVRLQFWSTTYTKAAVQRALEAGLLPNLFYADDLESAQQAVDYGIVGLLTNDIGFIKRNLKLEERA